MKISVIVPIYKVEKYLCQCIDSIINQTLKDIEIILIDEGDMDECRKIIDMYEFGSKKDSRVKSIHEKNGGYGASVNKGIDIAQGEYISIIESDDFIEPEMFEEMYNYAKNLDADVVKTPYFEYKEQSDGKCSKDICNYAEKITNSCPKNTVFSILDYPQLMGVHASLWSGIYRTKYLREKNIRFIEAKGSAYVDVGFRIDTLTKTDRIGWLNKAFYNYRLSSENSSTNNFNLDTMLKRWEEAHNSFKNRFYVYEKTGPELIFDEYYNTAGYLIRPYMVNENQIKKMRELYNNIPDNIIMTAPNLKKKQKKLMLDIKYGKLTKPFKPKWYSFQISIKKECAKIHLFRYIRNKIFEKLFIVGKDYKVYFIIGNIKPITKN